MGEPDGGHEVLIERVHPAVAEEAREVQRPAAALHPGAQLHERRRPEKLARLDRLRDPHDVLWHDAARPEVQVPHFTVADLSLGKTHSEPRRVEQRAGRFRPEAMPGGRPPELDGVTLPLLAAQARSRVTTDGAWFYQEPGGKRLARLARGAVLMGGETQGDWQGVMLEGWIFTTSVGPTPRAGYDLTVTRAPEENLRSAPAGALIGKLPQGFLLNKVAEGTSGRWIHVTRAGWVEKTDLETVAQVASSRMASADTGSGEPTPGLRPGAPGTPGHGPGVGQPDTNPNPSAPV